MMIRGSAVLFIAVLFAQGSVAPDLGRVNDAKVWSVIGADASAEGPVVRLKPHGDPAVGSHIGLALVQNLKFTEGTLEIDRLGHREGTVGLWVDSMPGAFRNLRIHPAR